MAAKKRTIDVATTEAKRSASGMDSPSVGIGIYSLLCTNRIVMIWSVSNIEKKNSILLQPIFMKLNLILDHNQYCYYDCVLDLICSV